MKKIYTILLLVLTLCLFACNPKAETVNLYIDGNLYRAINVNEYNMDSLKVREKKNTLFDGWYLDSEYEEKYEFDSTNNSINLYGRYLEDSCLISFESNGGTPIESYIVKCGVKISEPLAPTKLNYEFDGWYCDPYLVRPYDFNTVVNGSKTLYAKYNIKSELHIGAMRNNNTVMLEKLGLDTGYDSIAEDDSIKNLSKLTYNPNIPQKNNLSSRINKISILALDMKPKKMYNKKLPPK